MRPVKAPESREAWILEIVRGKPVAVDSRGQERYVTFSAGVSEWKSGQSIAEWITNADDAVYKAKSLGRNRVVLGD
ncbi:diguanylate cyclase [Paenibacillus sp. P26]|nr:diguanylate cyclase [Paenibacillus sp. P26]